MAEQDFPRPIRIGARAVRWHEHEVLAFIASRPAPALTGRRRDGMGATELVHALGGRMHGTSGMCRCPAHDDSTPSLSVTERDGRMLVHCQAGCSQADVIDALATRELDIRRPRAGGIDDYRHPMLGRPSSVWPYRDTDGRLVGYAARFDTNDGKAFRPLVRDNERWYVHGLPRPYPLFRLPDLIARPDAPVLIVEGEKAADAGAQRFSEMVAITSMHGATLLTGIAALIRTYVSLPPALADTVALWIVMT